MKKHTAAVLWLTAMLMLLCGCGKVWGVERSIEQSSLYSRHEIEQAMDLITRDFRAAYDKCSLLELRYEEQWNLDRASSEARQHGADEAIIIRGSFRTGDTNNAFNPNFTYSNYSWILTRSGISGWRISGRGYG